MILALRTYPCTIMAAGLGIKRRGVYFVELILSQSERNLIGDH
ncbi:MAG: hypothetical protein ACI8RD_002559 [Bacillariaceae sp.]|jgi:hypothetical protein